MIYHPETETFNHDQVMLNMVIDKMVTTMGYDFWYYIAVYVINGF